LQERWHVDGKSGALRAGVFGISDGLVSNLTLILGVAASGAAAHFVIVAGLAGLLAGAFSMAAGEYISMQIQRETFQYALRVEAAEIDLVPDAERRELVDIYTGRGIPIDTALTLADQVMEDPARALDVHAREELGLDPGQLGSPVGAAMSSFLAFAVGATVPLTPYLLFSDGAALIGAVICGAIALAVVGGVMAHMTARYVAMGALRMLGLGMAAAAVTYGIGSLLGIATG